MMSRNALKRSAVHRVDLPTIYEEKNARTGSV